jgi:hypothetical protein
MEEGIIHRPDHGISGWRFIAYFGKWNIIVIVMLDYVASGSVEDYATS